jgi:hypothetical protein
VRMREASGQLRGAGNRPGRNDRHHPVLAAHVVPRHAIYTAPRDNQHIHW